MGPDEQRIKIRMALRALDERDLEANIVTWLKHAAIQGTEDTPRVLLSELFHGLDASNVNGRKQRFRLSRHLVCTSAYVEIGEIVPSIVRTLVKRASEEKSQGLYDEEAKFLQDLTDSALTLAQVQDAKEWVYHTLAKPFLDVIAKTMDGKKIAGCCRHIYSVLSGCVLSTHIEMDISQAIARDTLKRLHRFFHHHRSTCVKISEAYAVQDKCIEIVQLDLSPLNVQSFVELFIASSEHKESWQVRKAGLELLTTLSKVYVEAPKFPGDSESREVLRKFMAIIQGCLDKARYDKIVHVRKAMQKCQAAFNGIALVPFDDFDVELEDLHHRQVGIKGNARARPTSAARKRFTRPKAKVGNDFGIQIFVPMEEENEVVEEHGRERKENSNNNDEAPSPSPSSSPDRFGYSEGNRSSAAAAAAAAAAAGERASSFLEEEDHHQVHQDGTTTFERSLFRDSLVAEDNNRDSIDQPQNQQHMSISNHTLDSLVTIHAREIEKFYRERERDELQNLKTKFEKHFKKLQEAFERDSMKVKGVIQNAIDKEIDFFKKDRLPKLAKLLSEKQSCSS